MTDPKKALELSIVLPTYKERDNLAILIPEIEKNFRNLSLEIIVVDDNSQDGTKELIKKFNNDFGNIRLMTRPALNGIGSALRDGYNAATGEYIISADADLSCTVPDMIRLYHKIKEGFDMVIGYRHGPSGYYARNTPGMKAKYLISKLGNAVMKMVSGVKLREFSLNFRIIRRDKWLTIKTSEVSNSFLFEMILRMWRKNLKIAEIPVSFYERKYGKSKMILWKQMLKSLISLFKLSFKN